MVKKYPEGLLRIGVIGAGVRGRHLAGQLVSSSVQNQVVAVAEPDLGRRLAFARDFNLAEDEQFSGWEAFADSLQVCDAVIIATMDNQHTGPALACLHRGCHILIEKPLANTFRDCLQIERKRRDTKRVVQVCHTLRYRDSFRRIKQIVDDGALGRIIHIDHMEAIGHLRFSHNYVRGRWSREEGNTFLLLHKCSHDIDFLSWLVKEPCSRVSSFGSLSYFTSDQAPGDSGKRCLDDCRIESDCIYSARRLYIDNDLTGRISDLGDATDKTARLEAVRNGPYGACVWRAGNNVVDHQVVTMEFGSGISATCTLSGYSATHGRRSHIQGAEGELFFDEADGVITINKFDGSESEAIRVQQSSSSHAEDEAIVNTWLSAIANPSANTEGVDACEALRTIAAVFAAEVSRKENRVVEMSEYVTEC